ncbi:hypothetical protein EV421DRAFT_1900607 [Armillaria borealis]|uniref:Uncharacterized protein n=1 Tax=Armillaria borealis TaxID=47425 RepID=A0AA39JS71_9AGAR|nr:hypothetical protein EV421DRAFT_1900607 [Armillaria borealis]
MKAKEAQAEALRLKEVAWAAKLEALKQQVLEKEWLRLEVEEKKRLWVETKEKQWKLDLEKGLEEATAKKVLKDLAKAKEKADEDNEKLLAAAGFVPSGKEGDSELDLADLKTVAMDELRRRCRIAEEKKKVGPAESRKCKFRSASVVESGGEDGNASAGPSRPKRLKMKPEPTAQNKVFTGSVHPENMPTPSHDPPRTIHAPLSQLLLSGSPNREWASRFREIPLPQDTARLSSNPPPQEFTPIPYNLMVNPEPYSQEPSPSPTDYTHKPSPVPTVCTWHVTNGVIGGASPPSTSSDSSNGSG